ncbi:MAG: DegT/DnrJ/EryC1/StrS family aminotransferase [Vicinamibacterales bacterium]
MAFVPFNDLKLHHQRLQPALDEAFARLLSQSSFVRGPDVDGFEHEYAAHVGVKHCVSCGNGTDAIYIALRALGAGPGDEVITTAHSWIATSEAISQTGATVVFCDTDPDTFTIDPADVAAKITPRTRGIIPVHLYGQPAAMRALQDLAKDHGLWIVEDCAQAHMATYDGAIVGTMGDIGTFSFYPGKNLGALGDAGALVTNRPELAEWATLFARHGGKGDHQIEGINSRMDGLQGMVLRLKLPHLAEWTVARRCIAARYDDALSQVGDITTPRVAAGRTHVYHLYVIRTGRRDELRQHLQQAGVETLLNYPRALPFYKAYSRLGHSPSDFPNAYRNQHEILSLPIFPEMTDQQQDHVVTSIRAFFRAS